MDLNELDLDNVGSWPALYRGLSIVVVCFLLAGGFYYNVTVPQLEQIKVIEAKEQELKKAFTLKAEMSANLEAYRAQMVEINLIFDTLISKLPTTKEIASLLDDISFIGGDNGLQFKSINWGEKKDQELSIEVPISIKVVGTYDQLGSFAADIAALPRIVILDDIRLTKGAKAKDKKTLLTLNVIAKTYRYKGERK